MKKKTRAQTYSGQRPVRLHINSVLLLALMLFLVGGSAAVVLYAVFWPDSLPALPLKLLAVLFCGLCLLVLGFYIFAVYLPTRRLNAALHQIADGDFDHLLSEEGITELSGMAGEFNSVLLSVRQIINNEYNSKLLKKRAELNALQSQINPHFLYNTIDSIRGQALVDGSKPIADIAKALASIFRYCIDAPDNLVTVQEELQHVVNYFSIQQFRFHNRFRLATDFEEQNSDLRSCYLPRLTLQPLVENAIAHGLEPKTGPGLVRIKLRASRSRLIITVEDDGIGIEAAQLERINNALLVSDKKLLDGSPKKTSGNRCALLNVNERIRITFGEAYGVRLYSTYGVGTQCEIVIPMISVNPEYNL